MNRTVRRRLAVCGGHRLSYLEAGPSDGPVVLLLHGLLSEATTWEPLLEQGSAQGLHVVALDLLGHGESDKPPLGYSLDDFAASISEFLYATGFERATIAGHSLGGAIAMQFAYRFPDQAQRLVLISSGGLGRQVHFVLRGATLPGIRSALRFAVNRNTMRVYDRPRVLKSLRIAPDAAVNIRRIGRSLGLPDTRRTFFAALNSVIEFGGQRGSMIEMDMLARQLPTLIVWSDQDPIIPVSHAYATHEHLPGSRLELFGGRSHEPHRKRAARLAEVLAEFVAT